ncbi:MULTISPECIES: DinB family protein [unclassified Streptomyces]|uniref:DinB family protein n=1 Tax=unclassified Streptomyces TaxID=2593676 RepID=UPI000CD5215F|nr:MULTISPECIES: DinB family protein [unclassified Streptomyces]
MDDTQPKADLLRYLQSGRDALLWKLDGLSEYDIRRPLTPTGTNLLGLVKHSAGVEMGYFGDTFARPVPDAPAWLEDLDTPNVDMWATAEETRADIVGLYHRAWAHSDATVAALALDAPGRVAWWGERGAVTLHRILIHVTAETHRHAGHADIVREQIDGAAGLAHGNDNLPGQDTDWWAEYRERLERTAREADRG